MAFFHCTDFDLSFYLPPLFVSSSGSFLFRVPLLLKVCPKTPSHLTHYTFVPLAVASASRIVRFTSSFFHMLRHHQSIIHFPACSKSCKHWVASILSSISRNRRDPPAAT